MSAASVRATQGLCCLLTVDGLLATRRRRATTDDRVDAADRLVKSVTRKRIRVGNARRVVHHERRKRCAFRPRQRQPTADSPKGGRQQGCGLATEKGVAWPGLAVLGGSGEGPGGTWCMEDGTTSAGSMRFGQSHLLTPTAHLGHPPRQPVSAGDARSGKRREDAACRVSTAHVREGHNAVAVTPARWRVLRESCAR